MKKAEKEARHVATLTRTLEGPPRVVAVGTRPESMEHWREQVAKTGLDVAVVEDPSLPEGGGHARLIHEDPPAPETETEAVEQPPEEAEPPGAPLRVTIHDPHKSQTVRIETGPEGTEIHLDG